MPKDSEFILFYEIFSYVHVYQRNQIICYKNFDKSLLIWYSGNDTDNTSQNININVSDILTSVICLAILTEHSLNHEKLESTSISGYHLVGGFH